MCISMFRNSSVLLQALAAKGFCSASPRGEGILLLGPSSRPWPSPAPPLQPPMFPDQRRTRQLAGRSLPPPFCCWLRPCRSATGGNSRSTVRAHQQPVQRPAMSPPASRACAALLHIALLCRADRFSPSTLSVTMRRVLCAVCPMLRHRQCGCIALRVQFATAYRKRRGGSKRRQTSTSFWRGLYFTVQNAVPALLCGCARAA